jgi:hypothetical protein
MAGSATIGSLKVVLGLDTAQFESNLARARNSIAGFNPAAGIKTALKEVGASLDEVASHAGIVGKSLSEMGTVGLAAGVALGGLSIAAGVAFEALRKTREAVGELAEFGKLAKTVGVSTDFIQQFNYAAQQSEVDVGAADEALKGLNISLGLVSSGLARSLQVKAFAAVGFTPEQLRQFHDVGDFFPVLVERIAALGNAAEQAAIAKRLGISELLPLLREGATNFNTLARAAQDLHVVVSADLIEGAVEAKKKLSELDSLMKAQKDETFAEYAKTLLTIAEAFSTAERAGLKFLSAITGTTSLDDKIANLTAQRTDAAINVVKNRAGVLDGAFQAKLDRVSRDLDAAILQRNIQQGVGPGSGKPGAPAKPLVPGAEGHSNVTASDEAIARAAKDELNARIALTQNIAELTVLRLAEVEQETAAANRKLQDEANSKKITQAAADIAIASNNQAALEKKALITRQAAFEAQNAELAQRQALAGYAQQAAQIEAALAKTAQARNAIEAKALADQQKLDRAKLEAENQQLLVTGKRTALEALDLLDAQKLAQVEQTRQQAVQALAAIQKEASERAQASLQLQIELLSSQADAATTQATKNQISDRILQIEQQLERQKLEEVVASATASQAERDIAAARLKQLPTIQANERAAKGQADFDRALQDATSETERFAQAIEHGDVAGAISAFASALKSFSASGGPLAALSTTLSEFAAVYQAGSSLGSALAKAIGGNPKTGGQVGGLLGGIPGAIASLFGPGPSNFTASAAFHGIDSATFGGDKPNQTTTAGAQAVAAAILKAEQSLAAAAGVTLGATVAGLQIGQRDPSKITLSDGQVLTAGAGDADAAVQAALKAVLAGAKFADAAEQSLVNSMIAAGKGFDDIVASLDGYQKAQAAVGAVADQLLQLTDAQAYETKQVTDAIKAQRAAAEAAAAAGDITAAQLAAVNAQLGTLQGLQLDQVAKKYADAASQAADRLVSTAKSATQAAAQALDKARDAAAAPLSATIAKFQDLANALTTFEGTIGQATNQQVLSLQAARRNEAATASRAILGDASALAALPDAAQQLLIASRSSAHTLQDFLLDQARVKSDVGKAAATAVRQVSIAQQQLDAIDAQVAAAEGTTAAVEDVGTAIANLQAAQSAEAAALAATISAAIAPTPAAAPAASPTVAEAPAAVQPPNAASTTADIAAYIQAQVAGGIYNGIGGQIQQFATGGDFAVGGTGGADSQGFHLALTPGEMVSVSHVDGQAELLAEIKAMRAEQQTGFIQLAINTGATSKILKRVTPDGNSLKTSAA